MPEFRIAWTIDENAETPEAAAVKAFRRISRVDLRDPCSASVFEVTDPDTGRAVTVDLADPERDDQGAPETVADIAREMLVYEREAFEQDTPLDLADLCTAFGAWRARLKQALGLELTGAELTYDADDLEPFRLAKAAGYFTRPAGAGVFHAAAPGGEYLPNPQGVGSVFPSEIEAWQACEDHRRANRWA